tara:strand:+ start:5988 stop:6662 length:675 start_codon:yes stop_codon:yes gene_type:complete
LNPKIITIDGPSGVGKGTIAIMVADYLGYNYLDSGSLYRSLALALSQKNIDLVKDINDIEKNIFEIDIDFKYEKNGKITVFVNKADFTKKIRTEKVAKMASQIAKNANARKMLEVVQRKHIRAPGLVADGRDMGTKVFNEANIKFFLTASVEKRAERRLNQLKDQGISANLPNLIHELLLRDKADTERTISPLVPADDAILVDTSELSATEVFNKIKELIDKNI